MPFPFNHTAPPDLYTLSLHDALPICKHLAHADGDESLRVEVHPGHGAFKDFQVCERIIQIGHGFLLRRDRKSTRLNSSHVEISYAVFCLKKKKKRLD